MTRITLSLFDHWTRQGRSNLSIQIMKHNWHSVCTPKHHGGLGIRDIKQVNKAGILKHTWDILHTSNQWSNMVKKRFNIQQTRAHTSYKVSSIWPGFKRALLHVDAQAFWVVGNGSSINIWADMWLPSSPIQCPPALLRHTSSLKSFISEQKWQIPAWFAHQFPFLTKEIHQISLTQRPQEDQLIWPKSHKGKLTFKDAYLFYCHSKPSQWAAQIWKSFVPPRVSCLTWKLLQNKLPTQDNLQKRGMTMVSRCEICKSNLDNVEHVFITCPFAHTLWQWLVDTFLITISVPQNLPDLWRFICTVRLSPQLQNLWISGYLLAFHMIWETRNNAFFNQKRSVISSTLHHIKGWLKELSPLMSGCMKNSIGDLTIIHKLGVKGKCNPSPKIIEVNWTPPHFNWIKANTDGMAAIGGIFRNSRGFSKGCFCKNIGIQNAFFAELKAFINAVNLAWQNRWSQVWFEMDSKALVDCIHNQSFTPPWQLINSWSNCQHQLKQMQHHVSHVYREGNQAADILSKMGLRHSELKWWNTYPQQLNNILAHEYANLPSYRFK
ncbi:hypothetical protein LguiB_013169 [Lonicera macranthoides]